MTDNWREFGRELSNELINETFATARLKVEIDLLGEGGSWETGGTVVKKTFTGHAIRTDLSKNDFPDSNMQLSDFALKIRASEVDFELNKSGHNLRLEKKDPKTDASLGLFDAVIVDVKSDAVDAVYTIMARYL